MADTFKSFSNCVASKTKSIKERAIAFLYFRAERTDIPEATIKEIAQCFVDAGLGRPNTTRLRKYIAADKRTIKFSRDKWILKADKIEEIEEYFSECFKDKRPSFPQTDSIIPFELVDGTRVYLEQVVTQINGCYDACFYDASGVMLRRLVETLIIEVFEHKKIQSKIKDKDDNYFSLEKLISFTLSESSLSLGRNAKKGLRDAKWLGDQAAHNRRFLAKKSDIDHIQPNIRLLVQELLTLATLS